MTGSYKNMLFLGVIICNTLISTIQEIRSKKIIDKLSLLVESKARVIRNNKEKEVVKNYYLEDYINTIRYILTFDEDVNNKYSVYIENKISDNDMSSLLIRIMSNKIGNVNGDLLLNKEIKGFVPSDVANEIVNEIKNHFAHNHYIVYSSVNTISKIQILQNERFAVNIKLNSEEEVEEAIAFNDNINSKDRHATRVLKMI